MKKIRPAKIQKLHAIYCMKHAVDYSNQKIGKLKVLKRTDNKYNKDGSPVVCWLCECECGEIVVRRSSHLKRGGCRCKKCKAIEDAKKYGHAEIRQHHWYTIQRNAKIRDIEFSISIAHAWELFLMQGGKCALSGLPLQFAKTRKGHQQGETTASLDRIDSSKGYILGNIQWVHKWINLMKSDFSTTEFIGYCRLVVENNGGKNA